MVEMKWMKIEIENRFGVNLELAFLNYEDIPMSVILYVKVIVYETNKFER